MGAQAVLTAPLPVPSQLEALLFKVGRCGKLISPSLIHVLGVGQRELSRL